MANALLSGLAGGARGLEQVLQLMLGRKFQGEDREAGQENALERLQRELDFRGEQSGLRREQSGLDRDLRMDLALASSGIAPSGDRPKLRRLAESVASQRAEDEEGELRSSVINFAKEQAGKGLAPTEFIKVFESQFGLPPDADTLESFGALSAAQSRERARSRIVSQRDRGLEALRGLRMQGQEITRDLAGLYGLSFNDPEVQRIQSFEPEMGFSGKEIESVLEDASRRVSEGQTLFLDPQLQQQIMQGDPERGRQQVVAAEARKMLRRKNPQAYAQLVNKATRNEGSVPLADLTAEQEIVAKVSVSRDVAEIQAHLQTAREDPMFYADLGVNPEAVRRAAEDQLAALTLNPPPIEPPSGLDTTLESIAENPEFRTLSTLLTGGPAVQEMGKKLGENLFGRK